MKRRQGRLAIPRKWFGGIMKLGAGLSVIPCGIAKLSSWQITERETCRDITLERGGDR